MIRKEEKKTNDPKTNWEKNNSQNTRGGEGKG
jgi:hypothetical protein